MRGLAPPRLAALPVSVIRVIAAVGMGNVVLWVAMSITLRYRPFLSSGAVLSYVSGLRHALDADHITVIDLVTRRLVAEGRKPVTVGLWFSLGHSTIVFITCVVVAATSGALADRFEGFRQVGGIIGSAVSAAVLLLLGVGNGWILVKLVQKMRGALKEAETEAGLETAADGDVVVEGVGVMARLLRKVFKLVDRPCKMYIVGFLFGLGFDTSSEIAVLALASTQGALGTSIWLILFFPALFTAGMCLLDTTDGAMMMALYASTALARDKIAILYYSIILTAMTLLVASCIGIIQLLTLVLNVTSSTGPFWDGVSDVGDHYDIIGGVICATFVLSGVISFLFYKTWRQRINRRRLGPPIGRPEPCDEK